VAFIKTVMKEWLCPQAEGLNPLKLNSFLPSGIAGGVG